VQEAFDAEADRSNVRLASELALGIEKVSTHCVAGYQRAPRPETTVEELARLKPAFRQDGSGPAGNASGVNGWALGADSDLACLCDIRVASSPARFAESFVRVGIIPGDGGCRLLPQSIAPARAADLSDEGSGCTHKRASEGPVPAVRAPMTYGTRRRAHALVDALPANVAMRPARGAWAPNTCNDGRRSPRQRGATRFGPPAIQLGERAASTAASHASPQTGHAAPVLSSDGGTSRHLHAHSQPSVGRTARAADNETRPVHAVASVGTAP
jgi:enoyl-CoA hydratase/carnithine racemase